MSTPSDPTPRQRVWTRQNLRYHAAFWPAIAFCLAAGWFELTRARHGHTIAWVYTFEWPLFAVVFAWMWWQVVTGWAATRPSPPPRPGRGDIPADDPGLVAWRAYLDETHDGANTDRAPGSG